MLADKAAATEAILDRTGLAIKLLDEAPEDAQRAKLIDFGPEHSLDHHLTKSLFEKEPPADRRTERITDAKGKLKSRIAVERTKEELQKSLVRNTRAVIDPFLGQHERPRSGLGIRIQKRKAKDMGATEPPRNSAEPDTGKTVGQKPERANGVQKPQMSLGLDYSSE